ncbi:helix-turn-helix transcriptional regulator [Citrobacter koseri]|uniref:helix-turn-helix transcriptional regulator n=1 Tax=Citrobacter koseri TaxID=545 RepID=UPI0038924891
MKNENVGQRFIRLNEVLKRVGLSRTTLYECIKEGRFPKQVRISMRSIAFVESEIDEWIDKTINDSRKTSN